MAGSVAAASRMTSFSGAVRAAMPAAPVTTAVRRRCGSGSSRAAATQSRSSTATGSSSPAIATSRHRARIAALVPNAW
jgi:hypothetical protein